MLFVYSWSVRLCKDNFALLFNFGVAKIANGIIE